MAKHVKQQTEKQKGQNYLHGAAILTAGVILLRQKSGTCCTMVIEGSQYQKLTGFAPAYEAELQKLLDPEHISFTIVQTENSCLIGAALTAFAPKV